MTATRGWTLSRCGARAVSPARARPLLLALTRHTPPRARARKRAPPQNLEYKFVELLSVSFLRSSEAITREHISFRYQSSRARLALVQARLNDVVTLVKVKNPSLLLSLSRESGAAAKAAAFPAAASASFAPSGGGGGHR